MPLDQSKWQPIPWDSQTFQRNVFEIQYHSEEELEKIVRQLPMTPQSGHYIVRVNPVMSKKVLHECGFYYCDTLIEPYCNQHDLVIYQNEAISFMESMELNQLTKMIPDTFIYDRFHRDFNINPALADLRYENWLQEIYYNKQVWGLMFREHLVGFWAHSNNQILLHALSREYRGQGLSKYFWSLCCLRLFEQGHQELKSSISAANMAVLNLYSSLGFKFRNPVDIYHLSKRDQN